MNDSSQQLADSQEDFLAEEVSRVVDSQAADFQEGDSQVEDFQVFQEGMTTFQEEASHHQVHHHLEAEVTNTVHHQAHHLLTHRNKVFPLMRLTLVRLEDVDSASRIFG
jgi:NADPH-dependent curcumin reductase CurA